MEPSQTGASESLQRKLGDFRDGLSADERELLDDILGIVASLEEPDVQGFGGDYNSMINSMMNNNMMFLSMQGKVQNISQSTQLVSNVLKNSHDVRANIINNMRG